MCSRCGDLLDVERTERHVQDVETFRALWLERLKSNEARDRSGVWRFREFLPFASDVPVVSLGEGNTPLYDAPRSADYCGLAALKLKHQGNNPTGSFKDTGMTVAVTQALKLGMRLVACASTGNTAASLAAYAARARMLCVILVPEGQVSDAKLAQALDYGAKVLEIEGNFDVCMRVIQELAEQSSLYLVNSINPFRIEGQKTVAFELAEQLEWNVPDHLVVPGGNLGNSSALGKGFRELLGHGLTRKQPRISVIQAEGAAPFARFAENSDSEFVNEEHPRTLASAIKIGAPVSWRKAWRAVRETGGQVITVSEQEIADAKAMIGRDGIGCEPASATTVAGIRKLVSDCLINKDENVVAVLTGHILKDTDYVIKYHSQTLTAPETEKHIRGTFANSITRVAARPCAIESVLKGLS
ncbi:MAG TPA: threonine synthase [Pyrinomonadaceae bacterium]|nr:threonine synthase [Pyrinomonadaceae bacterium]